MTVSLHKTTAPARITSYPRHPYRSIGTVKVPAYTARKEYETAAWHLVVEVPEQVCDVYCDGGTAYWVEVGTCTGGWIGTMWGGVSIGGRNSAEESYGTAQSLHKTVFTFMLDQAIANGTMTVGNYVFELTY